MKKAIIIHGMPSKEEFFDVNRPASSNCHWLPWIQKKLLLRGVLAQTPEMPEPYNPVFENWKKIFEQLEPSQETILIGHSCGGGFLIRWLSENNIKVGQVILVAPWLDTEKYLKTGMFEFEIDSNIVSKTSGITTMYSTDDEDYIIDSVNLLKYKTRGINFREFKNKRHFCFDDLGTEEFPELLEEINL